MAGKKIDKKYLESRIKQLISEQTGVAEKDITLNSNLVKDLGVDSFAAVELVYHLRNEFGIVVSDFELPQLKTVNDVLRGVQKKLNKNKLK